MTAPQDPSGAGGALDEVRRRLYRADATDDDVRRYLDVRGAEARDEAPAPDPEPPGVQAPPRRRRLAVGALALVVVLAVAVAIAVARRPEPAVRAAVAQTGPHTLLLDAGNGAVVSVDPRRVSGPTVVAVPAGDSDAIGQRFQGTGNAAVAVQLPSGRAGRIRGMLAITSATSAPISWRVLRLITRSDWSSYQTVLARGAVTDPAGVASPASFAYTGDAPARVVVEAPAGMRWTLVIAAGRDTGTDFR